MTMMNFLLKLTLLIVCSSVPLNATNAESCSVEWQADWDDVINLNDIDVYPRKGEIITGISVKDILQEVGLAWNAPSWQEITGLLCVRHGPFLNALVGESSPDNADQVRRVCEDVFKSLLQGEKMDIGGSCRKISNEQNIPGYLNDPLFPVDQDAQYLNDFLTIENLSPVAFEFLEWLGPSPFSGDQFGSCSAVRLQLGMAIDSIIERTKEIMKHPLAILLDILGKNQVCANGNDIIVELVDLLSNADERPFCPFISDNPSNEEFTNRAENILDNTEAVLTDPSICSNVLAALNMLEGDFFLSTFYDITGEDLATPSSREDLCHQVFESFSVTSGYIPSPYSIPDEQNQASSYDNLAPGELLPDFYFEDALDIAGAFYRSATPLKGYVVLCTVFEGFLKEIYPDDAGNIASICSALHSSKFDVIEAECRNLMASLLYPYYNSNYDPPTSVRVPSGYYMIAIGAEFGRQLLNLHRISQEEVCTMLDQFYQSECNLQSVTRLAVDVTLTEFLPIAHDICNDYEDVIGFFSARYERYSGGRLQFWALERDITRVITAHLGYGSRQDVCEAIADGIDYATGRASTNSITKFEQELLAFLTDKQRCEASITAASDLIRLALAKRNIDDEFAFYTGYNSVGDLCSGLMEFFTTNLCETSDSSTCTIRSNLHTLLVGMAAFIITSGLLSSAV